MNTNDFRDALKTLLVSARLTQAELAQRASVSQSAISDFLNGKRDLRMKTACKLMPFVYGFGFEFNQEPKHGN